MKKLEEQESAINVACPMEDEASWVITCKEDHEEEITQFGGETVRKMMINEISTFLSNVDNVKISPGGFDSEVTRTVSRARMRFRTHCLAECCCASSADSEGNWRGDLVDCRGTQFRVHRLSNHRPTTKDGSRSG